jgi:hypothetical protein
LFITGEITLLSLIKVLKTQVKPIPSQVEPDKVISPYLENERIGIIDKIQELINKTKE